MKFKYLLILLFLLMVSQAQAQKSKRAKSKVSAQSKRPVNDAHAKAKADSLAAFKPSRTPVSPEKELVQRTLCTCFTRVKDKPDAPADKISDCMLEAYKLEAEAFALVYGPLTEDVAANNRLGEQIGNELAPRCPAFVSVVADQLRKQKEEKRK